MLSCMSFEFVISREASESSLHVFTRAALFLQVIYVHELFRFFLIQKKKKGIPVGCLSVICEARF